MKQVLLVEDDQRLRQLISDFLSQQGFKVDCMADGGQLLNYLQKQQPDLVILDVMLPGEDGFALCQKLRPYYAGPLLFMTAKDDNYDQVLGLELGADDYLIKPVEPRVLLARIHALFRRTEHHMSAQNEDLLRFGKLTINRASRQVHLNQQLIVLTSHEFDMLYMLASHAGQVVERTRLYSELIGREYDGLDRSADVRVSRLRKKLHDNPKHPYRIQTIWGKGFFFAADAWDD